MFRLLVAVVLVTFSVCANAVVVDYTILDPGRYPSVSLGGTTVTGSDDVYSYSYFSIRGLGINGGANYLTLDDGETMSIDFGTTVVAADLTIVDIRPPGNVSFQLEAFDGASSLGVFNSPLALDSVAPQAFDLFALSGVSQMTSFSITVLSPELTVGLKVQRLSFSPAPMSAVPVPAAIWLFGTALLGFVGFGKRRKAA